MNKNNKLYELSRKIQLLVDNYVDKYKEVPIIRQEGYYIWVEKGDKIRK